MKKIYAFLTALFAFWCCFEYNGEMIHGNPVHFEGWYDEAGREQMIIWMDEEHEYTVYSDELTLMCCEEYECREESE